MMPLRPMVIKQPQNLIGLAQCLADARPRSKIIAGGTDLVPNLKHCLYDIDNLISLRDVSELNLITVESNKLSLGAGVKLKQIINHQNIKMLFPALSLAAASIASPQIRNMATVGGNICLDTRCLYFNQSEFWRQALGYCLKKDGDACHVVKTGQRCVAASSNDLATMLLALDASVSIFSSHGTRTIKLDDFYTNNGEKNHILEHGEIISRVDLETVYNYSGFAKLRHRESIDFSMLSIGLSYNLEKHRITSGKLVVSALVAKPKIFDLSNYTNQILDDNLIYDIANMAAQKSYPQTNICDDPNWRKAMIVEYTRRAFMSARTICS